MPFEITIEAVTHLLKVYYREPVLSMFDQNMGYMYGFEDASDEAKRILKQELIKDLEAWMDSRPLAPKQYQFQYHSPWHIYPSGLTSICNNLATFFEKLPELPKGKHYVFPYEYPHVGIYFGFEVNHELTNKCGCMVFQETERCILIQIEVEKLLSSCDDE